MTVEARLKAAAEELREAVDPEPSYFEHTRPSPRRRRWAIGVAATAVAGAVAAALLAALAPSAAPHQPTTASIPIPTPNGCPASFVLPFVPTYLPAGWPPVARHQAIAIAGTDFIEVWGRVIEVWRGQGPAAVPTPASGTAVTVLGDPALVGQISDGWSVTFTTGDPANPCNHWALVGHPNVTEPILLDVATHLVPAG